MTETNEERLSQLEARLARLETRRRIAAPKVFDRADALESKLGRDWLSRLGIISLITGAALLIITYFAQLGPFVRVGLGYAMAGALAWAGLALARTHMTLGRIVFGGGLAIAYFMTYALHFVASLRVIESEAIGVVLVAIVITAIVAIAHRMKSETVAGIALFLALHTGTLSEVTALSLIATTLLATGAAFFLAFNRWVLVPLSAVVAVYTTHAALALGSTVVSPELRIAFVALDFSLFAAALLMGPALSPRPLALLGVLNWIGAIILGGAALVQMSDLAAFVGGCIFSIALAAIAGVARLRGAANEPVALHLGFALVTLALILPLEAHGVVLVASWIAIALVATFAARRSDPRFAVLSLLLVLLASRADHSLVAQLACVLATIAVERLHATDAVPSRIRVLATIGIAFGLVKVATLAMPTGLHTLGWVAAGVVLFVLGFALRVVAYRWCAFAVLGAAVLRLFSSELALFSPGQRILTFVGAGFALLVVSFIYSRRTSARS